MNQCNTEKTYNLSSGKNTCFILLQIGYLCFSLSAVMSKFAAHYTFLSGRYTIYYFFSILFLFVFSLIWQQVLKGYTLTRAYTWKGIVYIWTFVWSIIFFNESITLNNIIGIFFIILGVIIINADH